MRQKGKGDGRREIGETRERHEVTRKTGDVWGDRETTEIVFCI